GVVDEDHRGLVGHVVDARAHRVGARLAAGDAGAHLRRADLLGEQDRRLLPLRRRDDDDRVDPRTFVEPPQRLRQQGQVAEPHEGLRPILPKPLPSPGGDEDGPDAQRRAVAVFFLTVDAAVFFFALAAAVFAFAALAGFFAAAVVFA